MKPRKTRLGSLGNRLDAQLLAPVDWRLAGLVLGAYATLQVSACEKQRSDTTAPQSEQAQVDDASPEQDTIGPLAGLVRAMDYPDLTRPAPVIASTPGANDAAIIVAIEDYYDLEDIPGARTNADAWATYFLKTTKIPVTRVRLLKDTRARKEVIEREIAEVRASMPSGGRLWFVFIGHGMADANKQGHLLMHGALKESGVLTIPGASLPQRELLAALESRSDVQPIVVLDACYSGAGRGGQKLVPDMGAVMDVAPSQPKSALIFTASSGAETAGWLKDRRLPAFSYMFLGALRGWADADRDGSVNDVELHQWTLDHLKVVAQGQTPQRFRGGPALNFAVPDESGPDFADFILQQTSGGSGRASVSGPSLELPIAGEGGLDNVNPDVLQAYAQVRSVMEGDPRANPLATRDTWCALADFDANNPWQSDALAKCEQWRKYASAQEELLGELGAEYRKLEKILAIDLPTAERRKYAAAFARKYAGSFAQRSEVKRAQAWATGENLPAVESASNNSCLAGMVYIAQGTFTDESLQRSHHVGAFCMDKTEVTVSAYRRCVQAGACEIPATSTGSNYDKSGRDQHPVNEISWFDAKAYCEFAGKRLPSEWEWEWAARGRDAGRVYPWGNSPEPSCERAVMDDDGGSGCGQDRTWPVGSKPAGKSRDGLFDVAGNVWEWTADWYDSSEKSRSLRGGSWRNHAASNARAGGRTYRTPADRYFYVGVRCARTMN